MVEESDRHKRIGEALAAEFPDLPNSGVYHSVVAAVVRMAERAQAGLLTEASLNKIADFPIVPPMPTHEELEQAGNLYSQRYKIARMEKKRGAEDSYNVITHLKDVWMPWIEAGVLSMPELFRRDESTYRAIGIWQKQNKTNDTEAARESRELLARIPSRSVLVNRREAEVQHLPPSDRPARVNWAAGKRKERERVKTSLEK